MGVVENAVRQADAAEGGRVAVVERGPVGLFQELHVAYLWQTGMRKLLGLPADTKPADIELAVRTLKARVAVLEARAENRSEATLSCGFCGKTQKEVAKLIAGPQCYICNECVSLCATMIPLGELIRPLIANTTEVSLTPSEIVMFIDKLGADQSGEGEPDETQ